MEKYVIFILQSVLLSAVAPDVSNPKLSKQYRADYVYNRQTDAFYKLHIESYPYWRIHKVCTVEGAEMMSPTSHHDIIQLHSMFKKYPDLGEYVWVADDGLPHESAEEQPIIDLNPITEVPSRFQQRQCEAVTRSGEVETIPCYRRLPFICKVTAADAPYDAHCGVYGKDYKYYASVGSCYKIPRIAYTWSAAYAECDAEGAHLVVLDSETELEVVRNITNTEKSVPGALMSWFFFAGYRANKPKNETATPRVFKTVLNQTLDHLGFNIWSENEPNNYKNNEYCGSILKNNGKLNDLPCTDDFAFVCEKEVRHPS